MSSFSQLLSRDMLLKNLLPLFLLARTSVESCCSQFPVNKYSRLFGRRFSFSCTTSMSFKAIESGNRNDPSYKIYYEGPNGAISPWHDIPLYADQQNRILNMIVEIPRWTNAKMEISTKGKLNYIKQDEKKGKLRYVGNVFPFHGYMWNYGAFPQTWEDPTHVDEFTNAKGDNDPLDVCEIGDTVHPRGAVIQVKVLGIMAMIDEGETDWKVLVIDVNDPLADKLVDVEDIEKYKPGLLKSTYDWFVLYKIPDGKPKNVFAFNGEAKNREFAMNIVAQTAEQWRKFVMSQPTEDSLCAMNTGVDGSPSRVNQDVADAELASAPALGEDAPLPNGLGTQHFVS